MQPGPWWFRFHAVPDLPEQVLVGHEAAYLDWFYQHSTFARRGIAPEARAVYVAAYLGTEALRGGFAHYRDFAENKAQVSQAYAAGERLRCPVLVVCGNVVGEVLATQLRYIADQVESHLLPECGHVVQEEQPARLLELLLPFLAATD